MSELTAEQISNLTALMDKRFARELEEIEEVAVRSRDDREQGILAGRPADQLDAALADIALATDYAVVRQNIEDVRDIIAARQRLSAGTYGICIDCGEEIAYERLLAYPTAKRCIDCQRLYEQQKAIREGRHAP